MIRGFSIIGILFVNVQSFNWPELYDSFPSFYWKSSAEQFFQWFIFIIAHSSFYPLFALLFGISMGFIFESAKSRGLNPYFVFTKRLIALLVIGAVHAFLVWHGDILIVYAILGFLLIPLNHVRKNILLLVGLSILLIPNVIYSVFLYLSNYQIIPSADASTIQEVILNYRSGSIVGTLKQNFYDWIQLYNLQSIPFIFISIFPMFLFGLFITKSNWLTYITENAFKVKKAWLAAGVLGYSLKLLPLINPSYLLYYHLAETFGGPLIGLFYALTIILFAPKLTIIKEQISSIGRMSMTNYLLQSIIGFVIFKGFGFYGEISPVLNIGIAIVIVILQMVFSRQWLKFYSYGPIESIWRKVTYGQIKDTRKLLVDKPLSK